MKEDGKLVDGDGKLMGASVAITNPKSQGRALSLIGSVDWIQASSGTVKLFCLRWMQTNGAAEVLMSRRRVEPRVWCGGPLEFWLFLMCHLNYLIVFFCSFSEVPHMPN